MPNATGSLFFEILPFFDHATPVLLVTLTVLVVVVHIQSVVSRPNIRGPYPWPLVGNALSMDTEGQMRTWNKKYGPMYLIRLGWTDVVVLSDYRTIHEALVVNSKALSGRPNFPSYRYVSAGKGLVLNDSKRKENWKNKKLTMIKILNHNINNVEFNACIYAEVGHMLDHLLTPALQCVEADPCFSIHLAVANVMCSLVYGERFQYHDKPLKQLIRNNKEFGEMIGVSNIIDTTPWIQKIPMFKKKQLNFKNLMDDMTNWNRKRVLEYRYHLERFGIYGSLLDELESSGEEMAEMEKVAIMTDIFGASQDTTAALIKWMMLYLVKHDHYQKPIINEIDDYLSNNDVTQITISDLKQMTSLQSFMHEVARHKTFVPNTIPHMTLSDVTVSGKKIPRDHVVFVDQHTPNHDPAEWTDPEKFDPGRFLGENGQVDAGRVEKYLMFGSGARKCPGRRFAFVLASYFAVVFFSVCSVEKSPKEEYSLKGVGALTLVPQPYKIKLKVRDVERRDKLKSARMISAR